MDVYHSDKGFQKVEEYDLTPKVITSTTEYNEPGLPKPPAGWGKKIGFTDAVDGDDEGPESRDEY